MHILKNKTIGHMHQPMLYT